MCRYMYKISLNYHHLCVVYHNFMQWNVQWLILRLERDIFISVVPLIAELTEVKHGKTSKDFEPNEQCHRVLGMSFWKRVTNTTDIHGKTCIICVLLQPGCRRHSCQIPNILIQFQYSSSSCTTRWACPQCFTFISLFHCVYKPYICIQKNGCMDHEVLKALHNHECLFNQFLCKHLSLNYAELLQYVPTAKYFFP